MTNQNKTWALTNLIGANTANAEADRKNAEADRKVRDAENAVNHADAISRSSAAVGQAGVMAAAIMHKKLEIITARSRELLFQMAMQKDKFRTTINRMKKEFPEKAERLESIVEETEETYKDAKDYQIKKKDYTDSLPLEFPLTDENAFNETLDIVLRRQKK